MQIVIAGETEIAIKTVPLYDVYLTAAKPTGAFQAIEIFKERADQYGDVKVTLSTENSFNLILYVKNGYGENVFNDKYNEDYPVGEPIYIEAIPEGFQKIETPKNESIEEVNQTIVNETIINETAQEVIEEIKEKSNPSIIKNFLSWFKITGFVTTAKENAPSNRVLYPMAAVLTFIAGTLIMLKFKGKKTSKKSEVEKAVEVDDEKLYSWEEEH